MKQTKYIITNSANYAKERSQCIGTKEGQVRTWVKKDNYHGDIVRATKTRKGIADTASVDQTLRKLCSTYRA